MERNEIGLKFLPQPDYLEFTLPKTHHILVTNDGSALTTKVLAQLKAEGNKVVVLNLPNIPNPHTENSITLLLILMKLSKMLSRQFKLNLGRQAASFIYILTSNFKMETSYNISKQKKTF